MEEIATHPLYLRGIELFNACEFFEAHEAWEELWTDYRGPSRKFLQGLIQAAVALHHFGNGNMRGAHKVYSTARSYLETYRPTHQGLDLEKFLREFAACFAEVERCAGTDQTVGIDPELIPEIHLSQAAN